MKITVEAGALQDAVSWGAKITPSSSHQPILAGVLIRAGAEVTLSVTDYEVYGTATLPEATVHAEGAVLVSARLLAAVAKTLGRRDEVVIEAGAQVEVTSGRSSWSLPAVGDIDLYPRWPEPGDELGRIAAEVLAAELARVLPMAGDAHDPRVQGGVVLVAEDALTIATTDCYRLAITRGIPWQRVLGATDRELVTTRDMLRMAADAMRGGGDVALRSDGNTLTLAGPHHRVTGRLLDQWVRWRAVLPAPGAVAHARAVVEAATLVRAIERASVVLGPEEPVLLGIGPDGIEVYPGSGDRGSSRQHAEVIEHEGAPVTTGAKPQWLTQALASPGTDQVSLHFSEHPRRPFLVLPVGDSAGDHQHAVMPRVPKSGSVAA